MSSTPNIGAINNNIRNSLDADNNSSDNSDEELDVPTNAENFDAVTHNFQKAIFDVPFLANFLRQFDFVDHQQHVIARELTHSCLMMSFISDVYTGGAE